jgi:hypothetical protein
MAFAWLSGLPVALAARDVAVQAEFQPPAAVSVSAIPEQPLSAQKGKPLQSTVVVAFVFRIFNMPPALPY